MMYLGIFVFAVLTASSLGQGLYEDEGFKCPFCTARGDNAKANCDKNIVPADCGNRQNPICTITKYSFGRVVRLCSDIDRYQTSLSNCEKNKNCEMAMCEESGCMAEFTAAEQDEPTGQFMCPVCSAGGENADSKCEGNIENEPCLVADPVCSLTVSTASSFMKFRIRDCRSREYYTQTKDDCEQRGNCAMAMCDTSGCKAEFPAPA